MPEMLEEDRDPKRDAVIGQLVSRALPGEMESVMRTWTRNRSRARRFA